MKKSVQNYIFMGIGCIIIVLFLLFHLMDTINSLMNNYNWIVRTINKRFNTTYSEQEIYFFGKGFSSFAFLIDVIILVIIVLVAVMVFLKIYWSEKNERN